MSVLQLLIWIIELNCFMGGHKNMQSHYHAWGDSLGYTSTQLLLTTIPEIVVQVTVAVMMMMMMMVVVAVMVMIRVRRMQSVH